MKPKLQIAHHVPGRIRMKIPSAKGNSGQLEAYKETLSLIPGIERIDVNPATGSIVLRYDPERREEFHAGFRRHTGHHHSHPHTPTNEIDVLANKIGQEAEFLAEHSHAARAVVDFCKHADRHIKVATSNTLDFKMMLALGVIGITIFEVGATAATPVWVTLTLFALHHYIEMQADRQEEEAARAADAAHAAAEAGAVVA